MHYSKNGLPVKQKIISDSYKIITTGTRMSGDMFTSLANGFSNAINIMFNMHELGISDYYFLAEGDDALIGINEPILKDEMFERLGFKIKMEKHQSLDTTSFCGCRINPITGNAVVAPDMMQATNYTMHSRHFGVGKHGRLQLLKSKAQSLYCLSKHSPIVGVYAWKTLQLLKNIRPNHSENDYWYNEL